MSSDVSLYLFALMFCISRNQQQKGIIPFNLQNSGGINSSDNDDHLCVGSTVVEYQKIQVNYPSIIGVQQMGLTFGNELCNRGWILLAWEPRAGREYDFRRVIGKLV